MNSWELLISALLISVSGFLASSEIALFSLSRFQLRLLKENFRPAYKKIKRLLSDPGGLLVSTLVANELVNVALSTLITNAVARRHYLPPSILEDLPYWVFETFLGVLITAPIILIFCDITPKVIAVQINQLIAPLTVGPLTFLYNSFKPIRTTLRFLINLVAPHKVNIDAHSAVLKTSEFLLMVEEGHKEGAIEQGELDLIKNVFQLDNTQVSEIATPLAQVLSFSVNTTIKQALAAIRSQRYSRIPVLGSTRKEVVGILYAKDLLRSKLQNEFTDDRATVATLMRKPFYVHPEVRLNSLFRKFKQHRVHMAIVKSTAGEITGIVTMSDVLDYLFEDFFSDEDDLIIPGEPRAHNQGVAE
jgi:putative hemolysin